MPLFRRKKSPNANHNDEVVPLSYLELQPAELLSLIFSYVDQSTLYHSLSLVNRRFSEISRQVASKKNESLNDILETFSHQLYQQFIQPADDSLKNKYLIKRATILKERLFVFYSPHEICNGNDMWFGDKVAALNELICERVLCDVKAVESKRGLLKFFGGEIHPHSKKTYSMEKQSLHNRTNIMVINEILRFASTRNVNAALFCLQYELESDQQLNNFPTYKQLLVNTRDAIIDAIPKDQLANYFSTVQVDEFKTSLDYIFWSDQLVATVLVRVADAGHGQEIIKRTLGAFTSTFEKLNSLLEEKRQENVFSMRP